MRKMVNDWKEDQSVKDWLQGLEEKTKTNYLTYFPRFLRFVNMTPDEIIQSRLKDLSSTDPKTKFHWEQQVLGYQDFLKKEGKKGYTLHDYIKSVQSFFARNRMELKFRKGEISSGKPSRHEWIPTNAQVRMIYQVCSLRDKIGLLLAYQCGLNPIDIEGLNIEDLPIFDEKGVIDITEHKYFELYRSKTNMITQTCLSNELLHDLDLYLRSRGNPRKGILLVSHKGDRLTGKDLNTTLKQSAKISLGEELGKKFKITKLRKSYQDALDNTPTISKNYSELMMGHSLGVGMHYSKPTEMEIKTAYDQLFPRLSINGHVQNRLDLKDIKEEMQNVTEMSNMVLEVFMDIFREKLEEKIRKRMIKKGAFSPIKFYSMTSKQILELYLKVKE
jgi:integrase